jgi:hypothetical protein
LERLSKTFTDQSPLHAQLNRECQHMLERPSGALAHDELAEVFDPLYLHEFVDHAGRHGLQYLTEAGVTRCGEGFLPPYAIDDPAFDVLAHAQELDFQVLRAYRENLLVHAEAVFDRRPAPSRLFGLYAASPAEQVEEGVFDAGERRFDLTDPQLIEAAHRLAAAWPQALPVSELVDDEERAETLLRMYWLGVIHLHSAPLPFTVAVGEWPRVTPLTRLQAARGQARLTTPKHHSVDVHDAMGLRFIAGLDGARTVTQIAADMAPEAGLPPDEMRAEVVVKLKQLARLPLLV